MVGVSTRTILFTDLVDSTRLLSGLPVHGADQLLESHLAALADQVERFRGHRVKSLGDGVMATFDSAQGALECAVAMQQLCSRPGSGRLRPLAIRVGISSGDVRMEGPDCFGIPVVEASRLCAAAGGGQVLIAEATRLLDRGRGTLRPIGELELKGLAEPTLAWEAVWSKDENAAVRVLLADDAALVREGVARLLEEAGIEVVGQAADADELIQQVGELAPDVAIVDVRMPPTYTTEGLEAAQQIRAESGGTGVLVLSQDVQEHYAARLLSVGSTRVGYLLKERVSDLDEFARAVRTVAAGGNAFEPSIVASALGTPAADEAVRELTSDEAAIIVSATGLP